MKTKILHSEWWNPFLVLVCLIGLVLAFKDWVTPLIRGYVNLFVYHYRSHSWKFGLPATLIITLLFVISLVIVAIIYLFRILEVLTNIGG